MRMDPGKASVNALVKLGVIERSEEELYCFGINRLFLFVVNLATSLIIGLICGMLWQSILFSAAYIPLRRYAGGYHAKTPGRCYCLSCLLILCVLMLLKYVNFSMAAVLMVLAVSSVVIFIKAPVASVNKPLSDKETIVYKKKARMILTMEGIGAAVLAFYFMDVASCLAVAVGCCGVMVAMPVKR